ncbi:glycosyltransferase [Laribacter hongkongensis]|uniref:glycosyltransferase n=1 Tax=Laribacter hongkongensis TaxID=168471 RepID=UPI001EFE3E78|nr:glycosyltransferase [Laribacter hongkongensis]MCG9056337.1 glycosyltransferase [Laribacter hongkongensis]MCG9125577.1 glycosyltransferase [Laribacter hongkongensis]
MLKKSKIIRADFGLTRPVFFAFGNRIFQNIRETLNPKFLNLDAAIELSQLSWYLGSASTEKKIAIRSHVDGTEIHISQLQSAAVYLVLNGDSRYFKKINLFKGVAAEYLDGMEISVLGQVDSGMICSLIIIEYDEKNIRISHQNISLNKTVVYRSAPGVRRCLVALRFTGSGRCSILGIRIVKPTSESALSSSSVPSDSRANGLVPPSKQSVAQVFIPALAYTALTELAKSLPVSNGSRYHKKIPLKVGIITDLYMYNFYKDTFAEVYYLSPSNFKSVQAATRLDLILYVSCWKGIDDEEWRGIKFRDEPARALDQIIAKAREDNSKLVFQSIEDPSNFEYFLPIAKKFDFILTSDVECIDRYKLECGHDRVFYGEYGANPIINNPIGCRRHVLNGAFFAGSWSARYEERCNDMATLFDSIRDSGGDLIIADRNHETSSLELQYPERFRSCIVPPLEHTLLQAMHKLFRHNLNFNSIKDSPTMCAMRVYEMQAMGVGILSNYARSVFNNFPEIRIVPWRERLDVEFEEANGFEEYRRNMQLVRNVLADKTAHDIASRLIEYVGFDHLTTSLPIICVICDGDDCRLIQVQVDRQRYKSCIIVKSSDINSAEKWQAFADTHNIEYFTWFTDADEYEDGYLDSMLNAFKYTAARYITRLAWFDGKTLIDGIQHDYVDTVGGRARTLFAADQFIPADFIDRDPHEIVIGVSGGYAIDPFELNYIRYAEHQSSHMAAESPQLSVIVPVFNNGRFLRAKCIESLMRNQLWPRMEVLLIDDGSNDPETLHIVATLAREHRNIRTFYFDDEGSGSASRPRNKGISLAQAPLISFLDPDNEISPGGYDVLVSLYSEANDQRHEGVDFISGYHVKVESQAKPIGKHASQRLLVIEDLKSRFLESGTFPVIATQPAVINRRIFETGELRFVEKAAGQDTLFGWELLCHARAGAFTDAAFLIYYAQRAGSIVNAIDTNYFNKKLILEQAQTAMLAKHGLMEPYLAGPYERFFVNWYLPKLNAVADEEERKRCEAILADIVQLYGRDMPKLTSSEPTT